MKLVKVSLIRLIVMVVSMIAFMGILWGCSSSSSSSGSVSSFLNGLPTAQLSQDQNNSIVATVLQQIISSSSIINSNFIGSTITDEVNSADPLYNSSYYGWYVITDITPTTISGGLQQGNNGVYVTDVTLSWINAQNQYTIYDNSGNSITMSEIGNGSLKEHGTYSYAQGNASISENGNIGVKRQYGNIASENDNTNYSASWNANGFIPGSQSFSIINNIGVSGSYSANVGTASDFFTDYTTGLDIKNESGSGGSWYNVSESGTLSNLTYNESDSSNGSDNGSLISGTTVVSFSDKYGNGQIVNLQEQFSGTTFTVNGNGTLGEINEEWVSGQLVSPPPTPPDFAGKASFSFHNLTFDGSVCYGSWPTNGTATISSDHIYKYDFSVNSNGTNCGCALISVDGSLINSGTPVCNINTAPILYLSLSSLHGAKSQPRFKSHFRQLFLKK
jgi:hypothetical protein